VTQRRTPGTIARLVDATPASRDRTVDFLRAAAILAVVCGHWLIATIQRTPQGIEVGNVLSELPALRPATWVFQVMGLFFVVGGFSTRRAIEGREPFDPGAFFAARAERLLRPTVVFVVVWLVGAGALAAASVDPGLTHDVARIAAQPLWFLAVYLLLTLIAPTQLAIHRRAPRLLVTVLPIAVVIVDALRFSDLASGLGVLNYLFVFAFAQELGFHLSTGWDRFSPRRGLLVASGALVLLAAAVAVGPYPVSMVGLPGARISNMSPPTVCILLLTVMQVGAATALRPALTRWLARRRVWSATVAVNAGIMTIFLWHLSAAAVVGAALYALDVLPTPGSADWWLLKLAWFAACSALLALFVALFVAVERAPGWTRREQGRAVLRAVGMLLAVRALAGFALTGFDHASVAHGSPFLGTRLSPVVDLVLLLAGYLLACGVPRVGAGPVESRPTGAQGPSS
jgi:fucose 4-O-acetylase-like acetyltransferase